MGRVGRLGALLGLLRFPSPQLRQQTRLPKFPTVPSPRHNVDFDDNVENHVEDEDGVELIDEADDGLPVLEKYS